MTKQFDVVRTSAVLGAFLALTLFVVSMTTVSAQEVVTGDTAVTYCNEVDALNYEAEGECSYEQEDAPFCSDVNASNYEAQAVCEYPSESVTTCDDVSATNNGAEAACIYETHNEEPVDQEETPVTHERCEIEGHKYELYETEEGMASRPLIDWVIGLMKVVTYEGGETEYRNLVDDATDRDGYYCLEWDGYTGTEDLSESDETYSFIYRVYELIKDGWENVSVEIGPDHDSLVVARDLDVDGVCVDGEVPCITPEDVDFTNDGDTGVQKIVSIDVSEENGYIFADAAFHVDFYNAETDGGDGETEVDTYKITGFVWEDKNENDERDQGEEATEQTLADWTVRAVRGESIVTDVTDANGVYELNLPEGEWTICVELKGEWANTFPNENNACYVLTVPIVAEVTEEPTVTGMLMNLLVPTAYAATIETYTGYDFGVVFKGCVDNCGSSSGTGSSGGSRKQGSKSSSSSVNDDPVPQVLGEATDALPQGAPNTGFGGTSDTLTVSLLALLAMIMSIAALRVVRHESK